MNRFTSWLALGLFASTTVCAQSLYPVALGPIACADKVSVTISESKKHLGKYDIAIGKARYEAVRVVTDSGAVKLEDKQHGIVWLQMSNKSMLFNEKAGKRLANDCRSEAQEEAEKAMAVAAAPTILDTPAAKTP